MTYEAIAADVEDCEIDEVSDLRWETAAELVAKEENLIEVRHLANGARNAAMEFVVGKGDNRDGGVSNGFRD